MALDDVCEGVINKASVADRKLIVLRTSEGVVAYEDACPHEGHPLSLGELEGDVIVCAKHLWEFELQTGRHISRIGRPNCDLKSCPARVMGEMVEVDVSGGQ